MERSGSGRGGHLGETDLVGDDEGGNGVLRGAIDLGDVPDEEGHVVDIGVRVEHVGDGVVGVVAVLPPIDGEAVEEVADEVGEEVVEASVGGEVVMANVVAEPAELLVAEAEEDGTNDPVA